MQGDDMHLAEWLIRLGFPDHGVARSAAEQLAVPELQPLWQLLQTRLLSPADEYKLQSVLKVQQHGPADKNSPELHKLQVQLNELKQQIANCKKQLATAQAQLQQWSTKALRQQGQRYAACAEMDNKRLKALALEAYAASSEKAVQLLAELHRRLRDRSEQAESLMHAASGQTGFSVAEATAQQAAIDLADDAEKGLGRLMSQGSSLAITSGASKAAVAALTAVPPAALIKMVAGQIASASVAAQASLNMLQLDSKLQGPAKNTQPGIQALLTARQDAHVKQFLQTEAACQAGRVARDQALYLQTNDHSLSELQQQVRDSRAEVAGNKAVIAVLEANLAGLQQEVQRCTDAKAELLHKRDQIRSFQGRNQALDSAMKRMFKENMLHKPGWEAASSEVKQLISIQLVPLLAEVKGAAAGLHDHMAQEQLAFEQVALHQLPRQLASGNPAMPVTTVQRFQQALQAVGAEDSRQGRQDALCPVLEQASRLHSLVKVQSPHAFLVDVADRVQDAAGLKYNMDQWQSQLKAAELQAGAAASHTFDLHQQANAMQHRIETESILSLEATLQLCAEAGEFAKHRVGTAMTEWWSQPAVGALPHDTYQGKNAAEWLAHVRAAHAAKAL